VVEQTLEVVVVLQQKVVQVVQVVQVLLLLMNLKPKQPQAVGI
jgi:hypothetical protein